MKNANLEEIRGSIAVYTVALNLGVEKTPLELLNEISTENPSYPAEWVASGCENLYHQAEIYCEENNINGALKQCEELENKIMEIADISLERHISRLCMIYAITFKRAGDLSSNSLERQDCYRRSLETFKKGIDLAVRSKDVPTLLEMQTHLSYLQISQKHFEEALLNSVVALAYAEGMEREDDEFFIKAILNVAVKGLYPRPFLLFVLSRYFRTGCVQILREKLRLNSK